MSTDCVFCRIVAGSLPAARILENADALAFLDIAPLSPGHMILIPKVHVSRITELPEARAAALFALVPRLARALLRASGAAGLNLLQNNGSCAGQVVEHLHVHLIPRREADGLGYRWNPGKYAEGQAEQLLKQLYEALKET